MVYNEKQKEYTMRYLKELKEIRFRVKQKEYEGYEEAAKKAGYPSMRQFYIDAINEKVSKIEEATTGKKRREQLAEFSYVLQGIPEDYEGAAVYALVDNEGKKYIGSTINLKKRLSFHKNHMQCLLADGIDGYICKKMAEAIFEGKTFYAEVLEKFPDGISKEELNNKEYFYLEKEGGIDSTYNMQPLKVKNRAISETMERDKGE